jgi:hypothetical protein
MRIATQLGELVKLGEGSAEISEEATHDCSIQVNRVGPKGEGNRLDLLFKDPFQAGSALSHERWEESNAFRFSMARAYSRQTSCGASWT